MESLQANLDKLHSTDKHVQDEAFSFFMDASKEKVDWAYEVWDDLVKALSNKDNRQRAIASQVLCNLVKSDSENRMAKDFDTLLNVTKDKQFVTARHALQSLWKLGIAGGEQTKQVVDGLERRFKECIGKKNYTLIRYDISENFRKLYDAQKDEKIKSKALELIESEADLKYRKKYLGVWK